MSKHDKKRKVNHILYAWSQSGGGRKRRASKSHTGFVNKTRSPFKDANVVALRLEHCDMKSAFTVRIPSVRFEIKQRNDNKMVVSLPRCSGNFFHEHVLVVMEDEMVSQTDYGEFHEVDHLKVVIETEMRYNRVP